MAKLFDLLRPSNQNAPKRRALPNELWAKILKLADYPKARLVNKAFNDIITQQEVSLWREAHSRAQNAKLNQNAVRNTLDALGTYKYNSVPQSTQNSLFIPGTGQFILPDDPRIAANLALRYIVTHEIAPSLGPALGISPQTSSTTLKKAAEAFVNIANNQESNAETRIDAAEALNSILEIKDRAREASRIAAYGLLDIKNYEPGGESNEAIAYAGGCLQKNLTSNEKTCMMKAAGIPNTEHMPIPSAVQKPSFFRSLTPYILEAGVAVSAVFSDNIAQLFRKPHPTPTTTSPAQPDDVRNPLVPAVTAGVMLGATMVLDRILKQNNTATAHPNPRTLQAASSQPYPPTTQRAQPPGLQRRSSSATRNTRNG